MMEESIKWMGKNRGGCMASTNGVFRRIEAGGKKIADVFSDKYLASSAKGVRHTCAHIAMLRKPTGWRSVRPHSLAKVSFIL